MNWTNLILLLAGLVVGAIITAIAWVKSDAAKERELAFLKLKQEGDQIDFLNTLRREISNILIWSNPDHYRQLYVDLIAEAQNIKNYSAAEVELAHKRLCEKYKTFSDFDIIGLKEFVIYSGNVLRSENELAAGYRDIATFLIQRGALDSRWLSADPPSDSELKFLDRQVSIIKATKLKIKLDLANDFYSHKRIFNADSPSKNPSFENDLFTVWNLPHDFEIRTGFFFKRTNEYAIAAKHVFGDGKIHETAYKSNHKFEELEVLDYNPQVVSDYSVSGILSDDKG